MRFIVVYDACVLYPAPVRDFLLRLALSGLFAAKWTNRIHEEWITNLSKNRPDLNIDKLNRTRDRMNEAVADSLVTDYESLIDHLHLPDENDRHILAAAIKSGAQEIVTFNLNDFPANILDVYDISAVHPDSFIEHQMDLHQGIVIQVAKNIRTSLKLKPKTASEYLENLAAHGLVVTADRLREFEALI